LGGRVDLPDVSTVMRAMIVSVASHAPTRRDGRSGRIAHDAACDQANRAGDHGAGERPQSSVSQPFLRLRGDRRTRYAGDHNQACKRFIHIHPSRTQPSEDAMRSRFIALIREKSEKNSRSFLGESARIDDLAGNPSKRDRARAAHAWLRISARNIAHLKERRGKKWLIWGMRRYLTHVI
jgi:hypothetical protein